jgi:hypothetical protein
VEVVEVVVAVRVEVTAVVPLMVTELGERLQVAGLVALVGPLTEQVSATVPVKELPGVTLMVEVLALVEPGVTEMFPLLVREKSVVLEGACQKSPQPAKNGRTARRIPTHFACPILARLISARIAAPRGLDCGPKSFVAIVGGDCLFGLSGFESQTAKYI